MASAHELLLFPATQRGIACTGAPCGRAARRVTPRPRLAAQLHNRCPALSGRGDRDSSPALVLLHHHDALENPARAGVTAKQALKDLVDTLLDLFSCGYSEDTIISVLREHGMASQSAREQSVTDCLALVFITLSCLPAETVTRWSIVRNQPVSERSLSRWRGFCSLIVNGYMQHGQAWYSVAKLQLEQSLAMGAAEPAPVVAERMHVVYQTLNTAAPRFPSRFD